MSALEIMMGKGTYFPGARASSASSPSFAAPGVRTGDAALGAAAGLIPLIFAYLEAIQCDPETWEQMRIYMELIRRRASGQLATAAKWMRQKVATHQAYKNDSIVPQEVAFDLVTACAAVAEGRRREPTLLGKQWIPPLRTDDAYYVPLRQPTIHREERETLLQSYAARYSAERDGQEVADADAE